MRKARKKIKNVVLCSRDMRLMQSLFESKVMSREQIGNQFFLDVSIKTVNRRLQKLMVLGLVKRKPIAVEYGVFYGYSLTQKGLAKITPTLPYQVKAVRASSECPLHDIALNNIRKAFESKPTVQCYYTENVLQSCDEYHEDERFQPFVELNSDAMAEVNTRIGALNLAIEFDATHKSHRRYSQKIDDYYVEYGIDGVLYVCASRYILHALLRIDKEASERHACEPKLYFALLEDVTGTAGKITFTNANRDIFCVR